MVRLWVSDGTSRGMKGPSNGALVDSHEHEKYMD